MWIVNLELRVNPFGNLTSESCSPSWISSSSSTPWVPSESPSLPRFLVVRDDSLNSFLKGFRLSSCAWVSTSLLSSDRPVHLCCNEGEYGSFPGREDTGESGKSEMPVRSFRENYLLSDHTLRTGPGGWEPWTTQSEVGRFRSRYTVRWVVHNFNQHFNTTIIIVNKIIILVVILKFVHRVRSIQWVLLG